MDKIMYQIPEIVTPSSDQSFDHLDSIHSSESNALVIHQNITVKFQLNDLQTVAQVYSNQLSIESVKKDIGEKFKVNPEYLSLYQGTFNVPNTHRLFEVQSNRFGIVEFELSLNQTAKEFNANVENPSERICLDADIYYSHYHLPDFFSVHIPGNDSHEGGSKRLVVEIISKPIVKPFLGGFINKKTEYHDAFTQTGPVYEAIKWSGIVSRECQTVDQKDAFVSTELNKTSQVFGERTEKIYEECKRDYLVNARPYKPFDDMVQSKLEQIKLIQRAFRRFLCRKRRQQQNEINRFRSETYLNRFRRECVVATFPKTKEDFNLLYSQIQRWKEAEIKRINQLYVGGHRIAELHILLDKEIQLLNGIERQRTKIRNFVVENQREKHLQELGAPTKWAGYNDLICEMDTLRHQKIRRFTDLYRRMKLLMDKETRIQFIDELSESIRVENQSNKLMELLSRERNLLTTNVSEESLKCLRSRELALFVPFIESYKNDSDATQSVGDKKMCKKCECVKHMNDFQLYVRQNELDICKACNTLKKVSSIDNSIYRSILRSIRRDEQHRGAKGSYAFIIQEEDVREIVENIWHGHSILSQCDIRKELRLPYWDSSKEWSPWNCILLTDEEARAHSKIVNLNRVYGGSLLNDIKKKHHIGRQWFKKLRDIN